MWLRHLEPEIRSNPPSSDAAQILAPISLSPVDVKPPAAAASRRGILGLPTVRLERRKGP